jgi:glycosyltransferase involved in cell wall biosynthesis
MEWYRNARLVVLPSLQESFGYPILEAMAQNLPMVLSDISVFQEVAGNAALYVEPRDAEGMAKAIHRVLCEEKLRERLRHLMRERANEFSVDAEIAQLLDVFKKWSGGFDGN